MISRVNKLSIHIIRNTNEIHNIKKEWNALVRISSKKPFLLSEFVKEFIDSVDKDYHHLILAISLKDKIIGIAPLIIKKKLGIYSVRFCNPTWCSDFIIDDKFRKLTIKTIIDYLFIGLKCKYVKFTLANDSPNFEVLRNECKRDKINIRMLPEMGRRIITVDCEWSKFVTNLGKTYKKKMKKNENKLTRLGSIKIAYEELNKHPEAIQKILDIERRSWKGMWWAKKDKNMDTELELILKALHNLSNEPKFKWNVWFLELNDKAIAYCITIEYCEVGFLVKTSYDKQFKKLYPGMFLHHTIIQHLFENRGIKRVDFLSDLKYHKTWSNETIPRNSIILTKGIFPKIFKAVSENRVIKKIINKLLQKNFEAPILHIL